MKNADLFKQIFTIYATELWSMPEKEFLEWLNKNAVPAIPLPENATNGDIIKTLFPQEGDFETDFDTDWWNAPYKRGDTE